MKVLNSCDELIEFVKNELTDYPLNIVMFQGDVLDIKRTDMQYPVCTLGDIFVSEREVEDKFFLQLTRSKLHMMAPTIMVPNYVKGELIATLKGEW